MITPVELFDDGFKFDCYPLDQVDCLDRACVYMVLDVFPDRTWRALDVGQSGEAMTRLRQHDRRPDWLKASTTQNIWVAVHYVPTSVLTKAMRLKFELSLRAKHRPPCGDR